jgi:hypothetical protein
MRISKVVMAVLAAALVQTTHAQELYQLRFRATSRLLTGGRLGNTRLTEQDLINRCVGATATATNSDFILVYNASSNSVQVVHASNGAFVCDVFELQGGVSNTDGRRQERLTFMFVPDQSEAVGTAIITELVRHKANRATIQGLVQFTLADAIPGSTNVLGGTNTVITTPTNNTVVATNIPPGITNITGGTNTFVTNPVDTTNAISATNTLGQALGTSSVSGVLTPAVPVSTPTLAINPITETNILGGALGAPIVTTPSGSSSSNTPGNIGGNIIVTNAPSVSTNSSTTIVGGAGLLVGTNLTNLQICSGVFTGGQRVPVLTNSP